MYVIFSQCAKFTRGKFQTQRVFKFTWGREGWLDFDVKYPLIDQNLICIINWYYFKDR